MKMNDTGNHIHTWITDNPLGPISPPVVDAMDEVYNQVVKEHKMNQKIGHGYNTTLITQDPYPPPEPKAIQILKAAVSEMNDRAKQRDAEDTGERSMLKTAKMFATLTGKDFTEEDAWTFMILLKLVRGSQGNFREDDYVDAAAYSALLGECLSNKQK